VAEAPRESWRQAEIPGKEHCMEGGEEEKERKREGGRARERASEREREKEREKERERGREGEKETTRERKGEDKGREKDESAVCKVLQERQQTRKRKRTGRASAATTAKNICSPTLIIINTHTSSSTHTCPNPMHVCQSVSVFGYGRQASLWSKLNKWGDSWRQGSGESKRESKYLRPAHASDELSKQRPCSLLWHCAQRRRSGRRTQGCHKPSACKRISSRTDASE